MDVGPVNYTSRRVKIDPADLIGPSEVAPIIGLTNPGGVSVYRRRHADFPAPVVEKAQCVLWLRSEIEAWARATGRNPPESVE
jgi:predicted DNA-binding transcriptional regulator AlpA